MDKPPTITYFDAEGRENLPMVLKALRRAFKRRPELGRLKLVVLTANGEGPALAFAQLQDYEPKIVAVTFPQDFSVTRGNETITPEIPEKLKLFFHGVGVETVTGRLPFDPISGVDGHNSNMQLICDVLTLFGGGFRLCIQAVLAACDRGSVRIGEQVICFSGDTAAIVTASTTEKFLSKNEGLVVNEIICKPRNLTISRQAKKTADQPRKSLPLTVSPSKVIDMIATPQITGNLKSST